MPRVPVTRLAPLRHASLLALAAGIALLALATPSRASTVIACQDVNGSDQPVSMLNPCPVAILPPVTTYQGTIALAAATSTTLTSGNVTMASGTALPATFGKLTLINVGANPAYVCWFGGTASASSGCELLAAGASDTRNMGGFATPPTLFSVLGTTFAVGN